MRCWELRGATYLLLVSSVALSEFELVAVVVADDEGDAAIGFWVVFLVQQIHSVAIGKVGFFLNFRPLSQRARGS
ncbi:MAG: hypothetical protein R3E89_13160 [Thiolinea sp.]